MLLDKHRPAASVLLISTLRQVGAQPAAVAHAPLQGARERSLHRVRLRNAWRRTWQAARSTPTTFLPARGSAPSRATTRKRSDRATPRTAAPTWPARA